MKHSGRLLVALVAGLLLASAAQIEAGDKVLRGSLAYVKPATTAVWETGGSAEFLDPAFPPLGRFETALRSLFEASSDLGVGLGFEYMIGQRIGIEASLSYTRLVSQATHSGGLTYTPYLGRPPAAAPERIATGPISGGGAGKIDHGLATVGVNFHVLREGRIDLYLGPLVGIAVESARFDRGRWSAVLSWVSTTPLADTRLGREGLAWGGVAGIDVPVGGKGWMVSTAGRYVSTGSLNPWLIHFGAGYRF